MKKTLIKKIKEIITNYGSFSCADVFANSSPCIGSLGRSTFQLAETFNKDNVESIIYVHDREESTEYVEYEKLNNNVLKEILELAKQYKKMKEDEK